ncbi:MAG TPA: HAD family hydrolase [Spirochaetia bacterium]|nr:HAD family hydrolase [Spirochaetia bacterium]
MRAYRVPERIGAFLFDIDGTLYTDREYGRFQVEVLVRELAALRGEPYDDVAALVERTRAELAAAEGRASTSLGNAMAALGVDIGTSVEWRRRLIRPERFLSADPALSAAISGLRERFGAAIAAVTNNPRSVGEATLEALGVRGLFSAVVGLDDTMRSKPAAEPYLLAARLAGAEPGACVSVGDRYDVDLAAPLELGMGAILVDGVEDVYRLAEALSGAAAAR